MMVWFLLKGSFMKKLTNKEMMMVNGGRTLIWEIWDYDTRTHIMSFDNGDFQVEPIENVDIIADR